MKTSPHLYRKSVVIGSLAIFCMMPFASYAQDQTPQSTTAPDNTANNKMHRKTADQQMENSSDRDTTQKIRKSIIADKSLSMYGHNVKIITRNGAVTLKGPVHSEEEKTAIASKAAEIVGQDKVMNQLTVKQ
jgi:hyperosmotically inducible periplasmic protein